jgi:diamine N-acetyltransferase
MPDNAIPKIKLRAPEPEDLDLLYLWENDPEVWLVGQTITPFSRFILKQYLQDAHKDIYEIRQQRLMIDLETPSSQVTIGTIDIFDFDPVNQRAGVGILIAEKKYRGQGVGKSALINLKTYAFEFLQLHQLYCNIRADNEVSLQLFKGCGFQIVGKKLDWIRSGNIYHDEYLLQLINPDH